MKVAVGLSGGVDSAVAAALLVEQGYQVTGVFLECWNEPGCRTDADRKDALNVALKLKIPFRVLDFKKEYREKVLEHFYREYQAGRTPNPDVWCNKEIKFGLFLDKFKFIATGHYAQIKNNQLYQSVDKDKDQTYFLAFLKEKQLRQVLFPIGHLTKKQVRLEAKKRGLPVWNKKDSTGICFVGHDLSFREFLKRKIKPHQGEAADRAGKVIGKHGGVEFYTIGQAFARPLFVIQKDIVRNRLIVGSREDLARKEFMVEKWEGIHPLKITQHLKSKGHPPLKLLVRIRHQGRLIGCKIIGMKVFLKTAEYGIAPGQAAVIYRRQVCLGGGIIS